MRLRDTRDDKRSKALIVRPRGTQRVLRPQPVSRNPVARLPGGSRQSLGIGRGSGMARGGGGGGIGPQAAIAAALASAAMPAAPAAEVFAPQPVSPFVPPPVESPAYQDSLQSAQGGDPEAQAFIEGRSDIDPFPGSWGPSPEDQLRLARLRKIEGYI